MAHEAMTLEIRETLQLKSKTIWNNDRVLRVMLFALMSMYEVKGFL